MRAKPESSVKNVDNREILPLEPHVGTALTRTRGAKASCKPTNPLRATVSQAQKETDYPLSVNGCYLGRSRGGGRVDVFCLGCVRVEFFFFGFSLPPHLQLLGCVSNSERRCQPFKLTFRFSLCSLTRRGPVFPLHDVDELCVLCTSGRPSSSSRSITPLSFPGLFVF